MSYSMLGYHDQLPTSMTFSQYAAKGKASKSETC